MTYVYLLQSPKTKQIYIGFTEDLKRRFNEHQKIQKHKGWRLIYYEAYLRREDAVEREQMLKHYGNAKQSLLQRLDASLKDCDPLEGVE